MTLRTFLVIFCHFYRMPGKFNPKVTNRIKFVNKSECIYADNRSLILFKELMFYCMHEEDFDKGSNEQSKRNTVLIFIGHTKNYTLVLYLLRKFLQ